MNNFWVMDEQGVNNFSTVLVDEEDYKGKIKIEHYGSSDTALTLIGFDETLQGNYYCKAKNPLGQVGSMGTKLIIPCKLK